MPSELDYRDTENPGKERIVKRLLWQDINYRSSNATKEVLYEIKTLIGNFMHKTTLGEDDLKRISKALNGEIDLENRITLHLREPKHMPNGVRYKIVRIFIRYERGGGPGLVWDRERDDEPGSSGWSPKTQ